MNWHQCDLRKELCAYGGIGSPILRKTDLFLCKSSENQNHFVFFRSKMTIVLAKLTALTVIKKHSQGIHEVEWHQCDLRKELCAFGAVG